jgi:hypothetical protein
MDMKLLKNKRNEDVIITQSAFVFTDEAEKAIKGGNGYISKPIDKIN